MLRYSFGENEAANAIEHAVKSAVTSGSRTGDIAFGNQPISTKAMGDAILKALQ